jgi:hypothetical protein
MLPNCTRTLKQIDDSHWRPPITYLACASCQTPLPYRLLGGRVIAVAGAAPLAAEFWSAAVAPASEVDIPVLVAPEGELASGPEDAEMGA